MISGAASITSDEVTIRSVAASLEESAEKTSVPPAISTNSETHLIPVIMGESHSSKYTRGRTSCLSKFLRSARRFSYDEARLSAFSPTPTVAPK